MSGGDEAADKLVAAIRDTLSEHKQITEKLNADLAAAGSDIEERDRVIAKLLRELGRFRPLNCDEQVEVRRLSVAAKRLHFRWMPNQNAKLLAFMDRVSKERKPKPFKHDHRVRVLAAEVGRTYEATLRQMSRLRHRQMSERAMQTKPVGGN